MRENLREFERENIITFSNRRKMIQFVSKYLAIQYKKFLKAEYAESMDSEESIIYWEDEISFRVAKLERVLKKLIFLKLIVNKTYEINFENEILKTAFKKIGQKADPKYCLPNNVRYEIKNLTFQKIFY